MPRTQGCHRSRPLPRRGPQVGTDVSYLAQRRGDRPRPAEVSPGAVLEERLRDRRNRLSSTEVGKIGLYLGRAPRGEVTDGSPEAATKARSRHCGRRGRVPSSPPSSRW